MSVWRSHGGKPYITLLKTGSFFEISILVFGITFASVKLQNLNLENSRN
jgi:hypothetical protein